MCDEGDRERGSHRVFCQFFAFYFIFVGWCRQSKANATSPQSRSELQDTKVIVPTFSRSSPNFRKTGASPKKTGWQKIKRQTSERKKILFLSTRKVFFLLECGFVCQQQQQQQQLRKNDKINRLLSFTLWSLLLFFFIVGVVLPRPRRQQQQQQQQQPQQINAASIRRKKKKSLDKIKTVKCFDFSCSSRRKKGQITV